MTDETKELFDAPYKVYETRNGYNVICTNKVLPQLCWTTGKKDANRLARLPELYDALANAVRDACQDCVDQVYDHPTGYDPVKQGCLFKDKNCCEMCRSWIELLRKVRDGE
jgi:hypothetical protein